MFIVRLCYFVILFLMRTQFRFQVASSPVLNARLAQFSMRVYFSFNCARTRKLILTKKRKRRNLNTRLCKTIHRFLKMYRITGSLVIVQLLALKIWSLWCCFQLVNTLHLCSVKFVKTSSVQSSKFLVVKRGSRFKIWETEAVARLRN